MAIAGYRGLDARGMYGQYGVAVGPGPWFAPWFVRSPVRTSFFSFPSAIYFQVLASQKPGCDALIIIIIIIIISFRIFVSVSFRFFF